MKARTKNTVMEPVSELGVLVKQRGAAAASRLLGLSHSGVSETIERGTCRPVYNMAAAYELQKTGAKANSKMLYFVRVPREKREVFEAFVQGMDFQMRTFADEEQG